MMPKRLVLVRHGKSEGNEAKRLLTKGINVFTPEFLNRHSSKFRLVDVGIDQAKNAGEWIKKNIGNTFSRYYVSEYIRALETAALLDLPRAEWRKDFDLRERDYGLMDLLSPDERELVFGEMIKLQKKDKFLMPMPGGGESIASMCLRVKSFIDTLHRGSPDDEDIVVCHGEFMWGCRVKLERIPMETYHLLDQSDDPFDRIHNCQILEYTRVDPFTGQIYDCYHHMRSVCPNDLTRSKNEWVPIIRRKFSNEDLLAEVARNPRIIA